MPLHPVDNKSSVTERRSSRRALLSGFGLIATAGLLTACQEPPPPVVDTTPVVTGPDRTVMLTINFAYNSYRIPGDAYALLNNLAIALLDPRLSSASIFEINGHTDASGRLGYNMGLSMMRAGAVMEALMQRGVPAQRMRPQGFGPLQPIDTYNVRSAVNRRVEVVAVYGGY